MQSDVPNILKKNWETVVIQNGNNGFRKHDVNQYLFFMGVLIQKKWLGVSVIEIDEVTFYIKFSRLSESPMNSENKKIKPLFKVVDKFPEDCRLDYLMSEEIENVKFGHILEEKEDSLLVSNFEIILKNGYKFLFFPADWPPIGLEIEMQAPESPKLRVVK